MMAQILKLLGKILMAALKVFVFLATLTIMVVVCLSASLVIAPGYAPSWMASAWNMLEALPVWEARDSIIIISKWATKLLPSDALLASLTDLRVELGQHITDLCVELGQKPRCFWMVSSASILFLGLVARSMQWVVHVAYPQSATTEPAGERLAANISSKKPEANNADSTPALVEKKAMNFTTALIIEEKKDEKKGAQKRVESPAPRAMKASVQTNKEDVPPQMRQTHSELYKETKDARKRVESPAPRAAKPAGMQKAAAPSTQRHQEFHALRQRSMVDQHIEGLQQGVWTQGGSAWPGSGWQNGAWQDAGWQGNVWAGHRNTSQWGRNGW